MSKTILLIEDDNDLRDLIKDILSGERYSVYTAENGSKGKKLFKKTNPDLVILDLKLPDISGESIREQIKKTSPEKPIIILTAKDSPSEIAKNLNAGADDYITKPFATEELLARIRARLRENDDTPILKAKDLILDGEKIKVQRDGKNIDLTQTEFKLLKFLLENKNKVLTRNIILSHVWETTPDIQTRVVDVYIGYLRKKIDKKGKEKLIRSKRGFGYYIKD